MKVKIPHGISTCISQLNLEIHFLQFLMINLKNFFIEKIILAFFFTLLLVMFFKVCD
jgi:hypothetical protein